MKIEVNKKKAVEVRYLQAECGVRYWEDAEVNGDEDSDGVLIPCRVKETWSPVIDLENGTIENWPKGVTASVHYKVCDDGIYRLLDADRKKIKEIDGYVPKIMSPGGSGYGDYVIMTIDANGKIDNWSVDLEEFEDEK